jgi:hypothetical protein
MKRLRTGLAAIMGSVALVAAIGVSSASASAFVSGSYAAPNTIVADGVEDASIGVGGWAIDCEGSFPEAFYAQGLDQPTDTLPHSSGTIACEGSWVVGKATLDPGDCGPVVSSGDETEASTFEGTVAIGPNPGAASCSDVPTLTIPNMSCVISFPEQSGVGGIELVNQGNGGAADTVEIGMQSTFAVTKEGWCGGKSSIQSATVYGSWEAESLLGGAPVDLRVDQTGVFFDEGLFDAESHPVWYSGEAGDAHQVTQTFRVFECERVVAEGHASEASTALSLEVGYDDCKYEAVEGSPIPVEIDSSDCEYVLQGAGELDLDCPGDPIVIKYYNSSKTSVLCTYAIHSQSGLGGVEYETSGAGNSRKIEVDLDLSEVVVEKTSGSWAMCGGLNNGETTVEDYAGGLTLAGVS